MRRVLMTITRAPQPDLMLRKNIDCLVLCVECIVQKTRQANCRALNLGNDLNIYSDLNKATKPATFDTVRPDVIPTAVNTDLFDGSVLTAVGINHHVLNLIGKMVWEVGY